MRGREENGARAPWDGETGDIILEELDRVRVELSVRVRRHVEHSAHIGVEAYRTRHADELRPSAKRIWGRRTKKS